jgi:hypothetical protein
LDDCCFDVMLEYSVCSICCVLCCVWLMGVPCDESTAWMVFWLSL